VEADESPSLCCVAVRVWLSASLRSSVVVQWYSHLVMLGEQGHEVSSVQGGWQRQDIRAPASHQEDVGR
jgi:hypothetical protein